MKVFATVFALMAVTSVMAAPLHDNATPAKGAVAAKGAAPAAAAKGAAGAAAAKGAAGAAAAKGAAGAAAAKAAAAKTAKGAKAAKGGNANANAAAAAAAAAKAAAAADNSTATATDDSAAGNAASGTQSAASATRTRACDQGDQSLASVLNAAVTIGIGQQAAVVTLQNATAAQDFADGQTRLQQFVTTQGLALQTAQAIADDDSFAQTQLKLLAASQTSQETLVKGLKDATTSAADLTTLLQSFLDTTNNAQDGASQALIDCFLPLAAVSG